MKLAAVSVIGALLCGIAVAQDSDEHALTIYSSAQPGSISPELYRPVRGYPRGNTGSLPGYAVVRHTRPVELTSGQSTVRFSDVAALIDPTTVHFESLTDKDNTRVLEQNFQFDLVGTQKLLEKFIDKEITLERIIGDRLESFTGTLMSATDGLVLRDRSGGIKVVRNYSDIIFPDLPGGLITKPTLEWLVSARKSGSHKTRVSYQTTGMTWWADYNVVFEEGSSANEGFLDVGAWVSIINQSGASYPDAKLKLIAGDVNRVVQQNNLRRAREVAAYAAADASGFQEKSFFEFHLYTLGRPTSLPDNSTKQLELFPVAERVPAKKVLLYAGAAGWISPRPNVERNYNISGNQKVDTYLEFENLKRHGLGIPLPAGRVRVSQLDDADDTLEFIGEDVIDHTPKDERLSIKLGSAFDVVGERTQTDFKVDTSAKWLEESFDIEIRNRKEETVDVVIREGFYRWVNWEIIDTNREYKKKNARTVDFPVTVKAGETVKLNYTVRYTW